MSIEINTITARIPYFINSIVTSFLGVYVIALKQPRPIKSKNQTTEKV